MDTYMHVTASYWRSEDGHTWSATLHPYVPGAGDIREVRFHGIGQVDRFTLHDIAKVLRTFFEELVIEHCGVQLELF